MSPTATMAMRAVAKNNACAVFSILEDRELEGKNCPPLCLFSCILLHMAPIGDITQVDLFHLVFGDRNEGVFSVYDDG